MFRARSATVSASASGLGSGSTQPTATATTESNNDALQSSKLPQLALPPPHLSLAQWRLWVQWRWPWTALPAELVAGQADAPFAGPSRISCPNPVGSYWSTSCPKSLQSRLHVCLMFVCFFISDSLLCCLVPEKNSLVEIKTFEKIPPRAKKDMMFPFFFFMVLCSCLFFFLQWKKKFVSKTQFWCSVENDNDVFKTNSLKTVFRDTFLLYLLFLWTSSKMFLNTWTKQVLDSCFKILDV